MSNFIKNRKGLKMAVVVDEAENQKGLVFLMHGFIGFKEDPLLKEVATIFKENNYTTVLFDATSSLGESDGKMEDGTMTGYFEDLEDVISWAKSQNFYSEPFFLVGHSLGGYCSANYEINHHNIKGLVLFSSVVSGKLLQETEDIKSILEEWKRSGIREWKSHLNLGVIKKSGYNFIEDGLSHDLLKNAEDIECPVLMIGGDDDNVVPIEQQKMLFDKIKSKKEFYVIKNADHDLRAKENLEELSNIVNNWIKS